MSFFGEVRTKQSSLNPFTNYRTFTDNVLIKEGETTKNMAYK